MARTPPTEEVTRLESADGAFPRAAAASTLSAADTAQNRDLGFGTVVSSDSRQRFLNRDGSFNVRRRGLGYFSSLSLYHSLLTMTWGKFFAGIVAGYFIINSLFALAYLACGPQALAGPAVAALSDRFARDFFFSVQTLATIGYGATHPITLAANLVVTVESLIGLLGFALATGILFARFSRPTARLLFSHHAIVAPYRGITAFMFRIANKRKNEMIELEAMVMFSRFVEESGKRVRRFDQLALERQRVAFFPLSWTIVHPIDDASPLRGLTFADLERSQAEFLIMVAGTDETFSQVVHARTSYRPSEMVWGARFSNIYDPPTPEGHITIDMSRLHDIERVTLA
jgi:inward rectifier potassium channel